MFIRRPDIYQIPGSVTSQNGHGAMRFAKFLKASPKKQHDVYCISNAAHVRFQRKDAIFSLKIITVTGR